MQKLLQKETFPHEVVFPNAPGGSVLSIATTDPAMNQADIILGQPKVKAVLKSDRLRWLHITSAGFTRPTKLSFCARVLFALQPAARKPNIQTN